MRTGAAPAMVLTGLWGGTGGSVDVGAAGVWVAWFEYAARDAGGSYPLLFRWLPLTELARIPKRSEQVTRIVAHVVTTLTMLSEDPPPESALELAALEP